MLNENNMPCLKLLDLLETSREKKIYLLSISQALNINYQTISAYLLLQKINQISSSPAEPISEEEYSHFISTKSTTSCSDFIVGFRPDFSDVCYLCHKCKKYTNATESIERALLSAMLSPGISSSIYKKTQCLKPSHFKTRFLVIMDGQHIVLSLFRLFYQFIQNPTPLIIEDNLLIDNLGIPNWKRVIQEFIEGRIFMRATSYATLEKKCADILYAFVSTTLLALSPPDKIDSKQVDDWIQLLSHTRRKAVPKIKDTIESKIIENPMIQLPPSLGNDIQGSIDIPPTVSNATTLAETRADVSTPEGEKQFPKNENPYITIEGSKPLLEFSQNLIRAVIHEAYLKQNVIIEYVLCNDVPGLLIYIPDGTAIFGEPEQLMYVIKEIVTDASIEKYTSCYTDLVSICHRLQIQSLRSVYSLSSAYAAKEVSNVLISSQMIQGISLAGQIKPKLFERLCQYPKLYHSWYSYADNQTIKVYQSFEHALASICLIPDAINGNGHNFNRLTFSGYDFFKHRQWPDVRTGSQISFQYMTDLESELRLILDDWQLPVFIISSIFNLTELSCYSPTLLCYEKNIINLFFFTREKRALSQIEELIAKCIARVFKHSQYHTPLVSFSISSLRYA